MVAVTAGLAYAQTHAQPDPAATVRHVYRWVFAPAPTRKGLYWGQATKAGVRAHADDFTDAFLQAMQDGFKADCDFDFLTCMLIQLPLQAPVIGAARVKGDDAVVPVDITFDYTDKKGHNQEGTEQVQVDLRRVGGVWKVANVRNTDGMDVLREIRKKMRP